MNRRQRATGGRSRGGRGRTCSTYLIGILGADATKYITRPTGTNRRERAGFSAPPRWPAADSAAESAAVPARGPGRGEEETVSVAPRATARGVRGRRSPAAPVKHACVIVQRRLEGKPNEEIAKELDLTKDNIQHCARVTKVIEEAGLPEPCHRLTEKPDRVAQWCSKHWLRSGCSTIALSMTTRSDFTLSRLWTNSLRHVMDDVPDAQRP